MEEQVRDSQIVTVARVDPSIPTVVNRFSCNPPWGEDNDVSIGKHTKFAYEICGACAVLFPIGSPEECLQRFYENLEMSRLATQKTTKLVRSLKNKRLGCVCLDSRTCHGHAWVKVYENDAWYRSLNPHKQWPGDFVSRIPEGRVCLRLATWEKLGCELISEDVIVTEGRIDPFTSDIPCSKASFLGIHGNTEGIRLWNEAGERISVQIANRSSQFRFLNNDEPDISSNSLDANKTTPLCDETRVGSGLSDENGDSDQNSPTESCRVGLKKLLPREAEAFALDFWNSSLTVLNQDSESEPKTEPTSSTKQQQQQLFGGGSERVRVNPKVDISAEAAKIKYFLVDPVVPRSSGEGDSVPFLPGQEEETVADIVAITADSPLMEGSQTTTKQKIDYSVFNHPEPVDDACVVLNSNSLNSNNNSNNNDDNGWDGRYDGDWSDPMGLWGEYHNGWPGDENKEEGEEEQ